MFGRKPASRTIAPAPVQRPARAYSAERLPAFSSGEYHGRDGRDAVIEAARTGRHSRYITRHDALIAIIVGGGQFIQMLDSTIMVNALPTIARSMAQSPTSLYLAVTAYLVASAVFLPLGTWLADRFGARTVFCSAIAGFGAASIMCGWANSLFELVLARTLQGAAGAMMLPVGRLILLKSVPRSRLVAALAVQAIPALVGPAVGLLLGGLITTYWSWRLVFFINVPVAIVGILLALRHVPNIREKEHSPFDWAAFILSAAGLAALIVALDNIGRSRLPAEMVALLLGGGIVLLWVLARHTLERQRPMIDLSLFRLPTFRLAMTAGLLTRVQNGAAPFLLVLLLQTSFGFSPLLVGMVLCANSVGAFAIRSIAPPLLQRFGFGKLLLANTFLTSAVLFSYTWFKEDTPLYCIVIVLALGGLFRSLQFTVLNGLAYSEVPHARFSQATSLVAALQQLAQAFGVGVSAMAVHFSAAGNGRVNATEADYRVGLFLLGSITLSATLVFLFVRPGIDPAKALRNPRDRPLSDGEEIL